MSYFDYQISRDLAQRRFAEVRRRSEGRYRLYWSTVARQVPAPRRSSRVWSRIRRLLGALWRWWPERVPSEVQVSEERAQTHPLLAERG
jgi:hypothetical protein